jgi:hypothetical protein
MTGALLSRLSEVVVADLREIAEVNLAPSLHALDNLFDGAAGHNGMIAIVLALGYRVQWDLNYLKQRV